MIPKQAIEKAWSTGWASNLKEIYEGLVKPRPEKGTALDWFYQDYLSSHMSLVALDPTFWQALGKALGWDIEAEKILWPIWSRQDNNTQLITGMQLLDDWQNAAHSFYDIILTGGDTNKFWKEIL